MGKASKKKDAASNILPEQAEDIPRPRSPYLILAIAIILPGVGQVMNNTPMRGMVMVFFMMVGAWICFNTTTPEHSYLGRFAGGWFIYAMSILDAYKWARVRYECYRVQVLNELPDGHR